MSLSALTLQQLRYLVALERHRSFGEAARACHVSQPALSTQVRKAEELLGVVIFDRSRQPVIPTDVGMRIVEQAARALAQFDLIPLIAEEGVAVAGPYRLGIIPTLVSSILPLTLPHFTRQYPRVNLDIVELTTEAMLRQLREGALDSGIASTPLSVAGVDEEIICHERLFAYLPPDHALTRLEHLQQSDLVDAELWLLKEGHCFRNQVLSLCKIDRGRSSQVPVHFEANSFEVLIRLVDEGLGITVLPELLVRDLSAEKRAAQVRPFAPVEPARDVGLVHTREHLRAGIRHELLRCLRQNIPRELAASAPGALPPLPVTSA